MRTGFFAAGLAVISAALVACGGGGGGGGGAVPQAPAAPTPSPTPYALGHTYKFSGAQTTAASYVYPSPSPYPSVNTLVNITQDVTVTAAANPYGPASAGDFHTIETDAAALVTHTATTDAWLGMSGANLVEYGYSTADDSGDTLAAKYAAPEILDQLPETSAATWTNSAGVAFTEKDADGTTSTRTYANDGTYTEALSNKNTGVSASIGEKADGSGTYTTNGAYLDGQVSGFVFSAPSANQITITMNFVQPPTPAPAASGQPSPAPAPTITPRVYTSAMWYGTTPTLYSQSTKVATGIAYPQSCAVPASYGTSGNTLTQTTVRTDTILGYTDNQTQTTYTNPQYGPVCVTLSDVQQDYYDYQDDFATATGFHLHFPGTALSTTTVTQTLTLQSATAQSSERRTQSAIPPAFEPSNVAAATAAFTLRVERLRHQREMKFASYLVSLARKEVR